MQIIRQNPIIVAVLGGLVLVSALVLIFNDSSDGPSLPAADIPTATGTPFNPFAQNPDEDDPYPRPEIDQLECGPLLNFDDIDAVLETTAWLTISGGESCTHRLVDDAAVFVRIEPGRPTDLIDGGELEGRAGTTVDTIGDAATWFEEDSTLSVGTESTLGVLIFRVTVEVPALDAEQRLEAASTLAASALPRFPGIEVAPGPPPEPIEVRSDHPAVDPASQSYLTNLIAREAEGDWTRGEGLIATLRLFAGEATASTVTPARSILDRSGRGIAELARAYSATAATPEEQAEIDRLLGQLIPTRDQLVQMAGDAPASETRAAGSVRPIAFQESGDEPTCQAFWGTSAPCTTIFESGLVNDLFESGNYMVFAPSESTANTRGWTDDHVDATLEAFERSVLNFAARGAMPASLVVSLTPLSGGVASMALGDHEDCLITLNTGMQGLYELSPELFKQWLAADIGHCYARANFPADSLDDERWWEPAYTWYLSDTVYGAANLEEELLDLVATLEAEELSTGIEDRGISNIAFFEALDTFVGPVGVDSVIDDIPAGLGNSDGIGELTHQFVETLSHGFIFDYATTHPYVAEYDERVLAERLLIIAEPPALGVERIVLSVPSGQFACVTYEASGDVIISSRPGRPSDGGTWGPPPTTLEGETTLLVTSPTPGAVYTVAVDKMSERDDCEDPVTPTPPPDQQQSQPLSCGFCEASSFFYELFRGWLGS